MEQININDLKVRFAELNDYDEFEITLTNKIHGSKTFIGMKIPSQSKCNAVSSDGLCKLALRQESMVTPLLYKKLTMTSEEKYKRKVLLDMKYKSSECIF